MTGAVFLKHGRAGKPHKRFVWVPEPYNNIHWGVTMKKPSEKESLPISGLDLILRGQATAVFARHSGECTISFCLHAYASLINCFTAHREDYSFSLVVQDRTLDLEADSVQSREEWAEVCVSNIIMLVSDVIGV